MYKLPDMMTVELAPQTTGTNDLHLQVIEIADVPEKMRAPLIAVNDHTCRSG